MSKGACIKLRYLFGLVVIATLFVACKDNDEDMQGQITMIEKLLGSNEYYKQEGVYVLLTVPEIEHIGSYNRTLSVERGDSILIWYAGYSIAGGSVQGPFYTNISEIYPKGVNTQGWPSGVEWFVVGGGKLLDGINRGVVGATEGDAVDVYMTSNFAFGGNTISEWLPKYSPIRYFIKIEQINKK